LLDEISAFSVALPAILGIHIFNQLDSFSKKVFWLASLGAFTEIILMAIKPMNNFPVINTYVIIEFFFISYIFCSIYERNRIKIFIKIVSGVFLLFAISNFFFIQGMFVLNSLSLLMKCIIVSYLALLSFRILMTQPEGEVMRNPIFWFSFGLLIYYAGNLFTFGYGEKYFGNPDTFSFHIWNIHGILNIVFNLSLTLSLWSGRMKITT